MQRTAVAFQSTPDGHWIVVDNAARRVFVDGQERHLTPTEFQLLTVFWAFRGYLVPTDWLRELIWPEYIPNSTFRAHISQLRKKLAPLNPVRVERKLNAYRSEFGTNRRKPT